MFNTLIPSREARHRREATFVCGVLIQVLMIGACIFLGMVFPQALPAPTRHYALIMLSLLKPAPKPPVRPPHVEPRVVMPRITPLENPALIAPPMIARVVPIAPKPIITLPVVPPAPAPPAPEPKAPPKEQIVVHTGLFGGAPEKPTTKLPAEKVQTGGFGSPQGFPGQAKGDSLGTVPKLGSFGLPEGPGVGNGTGGAHGVQGVIASAGFGSGVAGGPPGGGGGSGNQAVTVGGFAKAAPVAPTPTTEIHTPAPSDFQPVEVISKPSPVYTEEARQLRIQGEVVLNVIFQANGTIRVIGVVKSLGHGLDQAAEQAAAQIHFKPARRSGQPADFPATLRIQFRLADHSQ
jgi:TonB family protein